MKELTQSEPFDPAAFAHQHPPNTTCDVCALLGEIRRLNIQVESIGNVMAGYRRECEQAKHDTQLEFEKRVRERDEQNAFIADLQRQLGALTVEAPHE